MDIKTLTYFLTIAREGSMVKAAKALYISQPALSKQMKLLEDHLGVSLFERHGRGLSLTPEGVRLMHYSEDILHLVSHAEADLRHGAGELVGDITIGTADAAAFSTLAGVMTAFRQDHPHVRFHIVSGDKDDLEDKVLGGVMDFALVMGTPESPEVRTMSLKPPDVFGLLMTKDDPLAHKKTLRPQDAKDQSLLVPRQQVQTGFLGRLLECDESELDIAATFNLFDNVHAMVAAGLGVAITFDRSERLQAESDLVFRAFTPVIERESVLLWKKNRDLTRQSAVFLDALKNAMTV